MYVEYTDIIYIHSGFFNGQDMTQYLGSETWSGMIWGIWLCNLRSSIEFVKDVRESVERVFQNLPPRYFVSHKSAF